MSTTMTDTVTHIFKQATESFQHALETGVKIQQETMKACFQPFVGDATVDDLRDRGRKVTEATVKLIQKNFDESQKLFDTQSRQTMDLLKKAFDAAKPADKVDLFETTRTIWQDSLDAMRSSVEQMARANVQVVENWSSYVSQSFNSQGMPATGAEKKAVAAK
ncbi:MAG: hypothetical protein HUU22_14795 [Phycisphaerae bacterium]|nr:hypothetical protein [Phycisphaerae bacterium]NUQ47289.1 hypothetical protein [Phycisphaerae bacterium]